MSRAMALLARREHSAVELRRKLAPHVPADGASDGSAELDRVIAELQHRRLLSDERFLDVLVRNRAPRFGAARIRQELRSHALPAGIVEGALTRLKADEEARALALVVRKFGPERPSDPADRAREARFLERRGFAGDVIRRVLAGRRVAPD